MYVDFIMTEITNSYDAKGTYLIALLTFPVTYISCIVFFFIFFQAKKFVESLPQSVKVDIPKDEALKLKATLEAAGATVEIV